MDYTKFQVAVIELAHDGVPLTIANVVARLRLEPQKAERLLDRMAKDGQLDLEVDENEGVVVYRVRGLSPRSIDERLQALKVSIGSGAIEHVGSAIAFGKASGGAPLPVSMRRSVALGAVLGGLFPGLGLAYSAPWTVVAIAAVGVVVGFKVLSFLWLGTPFLMLCVAASAAGGALYALRYNQTGRRSPLFDDDKKRRLAR